MNRPNCFRCDYFKVTWDQRTPRACTAYGFKTKEVPSVVVQRSSGLPCMKYRAKRGGTT